MTQDNGRKVVVIGDAAVDWFMYPVNPKGKGGDDQQENWREHRSFWNKAFGGGVLLLAALTEAALQAAKLENRGVRKPELSRPLETLSPAEILHSSVMLGYMRKEGIDKKINEKKEEKTLRVSEMLGYAGPASSGFPAVLNPVEANEGMDILVLDDGGNGFRDHSESWSSLLDAATGAIVVHKMSRPICSGKLWARVRTFIPGAAENKGNAPADLVVIVNAEDLRKLPGVTISKSLSWERTVQDFIAAIQMAEALKELRSVPYLVVRFDTDGAILYNGQQQTHTLIFDPEALECGYATSYCGAMPGQTAAFTAALVCELAATGIGGIESGIKHGLASARKLLAAGFIAEETKGIRYPLETMYPAPGEASFSAFRIHRGGDAFCLDFWRILDEQTRNTRQRIAADIVLEKQMENPAGVPVGKFGGLQTVDRAEIEAYSAIRELLAGYRATSGPKRPLSLAVFGPPGSGKSFGVKKVAKSLGDNIFDIMTFNVSQFREYRDLAAAFHKVRDVALRGKIPFVFFDEFDSSWGDRPLGWLKYFLAPMQDNEFMDGETIYHIGKSIFVFAGGTRSTFEQFQANSSKTDPDGCLQAVDKDSEESKEFRAVKGPDFVSRLRGFINIMGPNRQHKADDAFIIRRAKLLRAFLGGYPGLLDSRNQVRIDPNLLRALLNVSEYLHGARSMEAIIDMSCLAGARRFELSAIPPGEQLKLHVDANEFLFLAQRERFQTMLKGEELLRWANPWTWKDEALIVAAVAEKFHENKVRLSHRPGSAGRTPAPFSELPEEARQAYLAETADFPHKLASMGYGLRAISGAGSLVMPDMTDGDVFHLAKMERERRIQEPAGYVLARKEVLGASEALVSPVFFDPQKHPLPNGVDLELLASIYAMPLALRDAGLEIYRMEETETIDPILIQKLARAVHANYLETCRKDGHTPKAKPMMVEYDLLPEDKKESNISSAMSIPGKLKRKGFSLRPAPQGKEPSLLELSAEDVDELMEIEHARWNWHELYQGRVYGPIRSPETHECIAAWDVLTDDQKEYDFKFITSIPTLLRLAGYEAFKVVHTN